MKDFVMRFVLLAALFTVFGTMSLRAQSFEYDGLRYYVTGKNEVEVTGHTVDVGDMMYLVIPATVPYGGKDYEVTGIGERVFYSCTSLASVYLPESLTEIGDEAFGDCSSLVSVAFLDGLTSIGVSAFKGCSSLISVNLPKGLTNLGAGAFSDCNSLESIIVNTDNSVYCSQDGILFTKDKTELVCYPCGRKAENYSVPSGVISIGERAFSYCSSLTSVDFPEGLEVIGGGAFEFCSSLTSVDFPESLEVIGSGAFSFCSSLISIVFPEKLELVEAFAFACCDTLSSVVVLSDTLEINRAAFMGDNTTFVGSKSIKEVFVFGDTFPVVGFFPFGLAFPSSNYTLYSFSDETLPEDWSAPASTVRLSLGGLSDKMPYTGKFPDLYIEGNTSSYAMTVDESSMTFDTAPGTHTIDSFGFWLYKDGYEADKTLVTINRPVTYTIDGAGIDDAAASGIGCYPGVADDMLTVSGTVAGASLRVIDLSGAQRMSVACTDGETAVDVSCLAQGMYFVLVEDGGDVAARLRFVKK